jgi:hypothetical protein
MLLKKDITEGFQFYNQQSEGLGSYFIDSIFSDIESLYIHAGIHEKHFGYHRLLSNRFPFAIYYKIKDDVIQVYAILDCR